MNKPTQKRLRHGTTFGTSLAMMLTLSLLVAHSASARVVHDWLFNFVPANGVTGLATDGSAGPSAGDLYVADGVEGVVKKYSVTDAAATELCEITGLGSASSKSDECDKTAPGPGAFAGLNAVAVDSSGGADSGDLYVATAPVNELQEYSAPDSGTYELCLEGTCTSALQFTASAAQVQQALEALSSIGAGNVSVFQYYSGAPLRVEFLGALAATNVPQIEGHGVTISTNRQGAPTLVEQFTAAGAYTGRQIDLSSAEVRSLAVSSATGAVFSTDRAGDRILRWEPSSSSPTIFSTGADTPGGSFGDVRGVAVDNDASSPTYGDVYVSQGTNEVQMLTPPAGGSYELCFETHCTEPLAARATGEEVAVALQALSSVGPGGIRNTLPPPAPYRLEFSGPLAERNVPAIEAHGASISTVTQGQTAAVDRLSEAGAYQCQITGAGEASTSTSECDISDPGLSAGRLRSPGQLAVDSANGHLYIVENRQVDEFAPSGAFVSTRSQPSQMTRQWEPYALAVGASGSLFVSSHANAGDPVNVFGPDIVLPDATTEPATTVTPTAATLNGTVNPDGSEVTACRFEYVQAEAYEPSASAPYGAGSSTACRTESGSEDVGSGVTPVPVHAAVAGLTPGKTYHFRLAAENANSATNVENGPTNGPDLAFGPPIVQAESASAIERTGATVHAVIDPQALATSYHFEYLTEAQAKQNESEGREAFAGAAKQPVPDDGIGAGTTAISVAQSLAGLRPATPYLYRAVATSSDGTDAGQARPFVTLPPALIDAQPAASIGTDTATLQAYLDPEGLQTSYHFEWGNNAEFNEGRYEHSSPTVSAGDGSQPLLVEAKLTALHAATEYHFRLIATNSLGTNIGPDETLATEPETCSNETLRTANHSASLPQCRAFEQVSPAEKEGNAVEHVPLLALNGDRVLFHAHGAFAGSEETGPDFVASRTATGWRTESIDPPLEIAERNGFDFSPNLERSLWFTLFNSKWTHPTQAAIYIRQSDATFVQASPTLERVEGGNLDTEFPNVGFKGGDESFTMALVQSAWPLIPESTSLTPFDRIYELTGLGGPNPSLSLLNVDPSGSPLLACNENSLRVGGEGRDGTGSVHGISTDGAVVFFAINSPSTGCSSGNGEGASNDQLYARLDASRTVPISNPSRAENLNCTSVACQSAATSGAAFAGASADGSRVLFLSPRQLTDEASEDSTPTDSAANGNRCPDTTGPNGCNLYMYDFSRPTGHNLIALSAGDASGVGPHVQGVVRLSEDGSKVYFVAHGLLTAQPNSLGEVARAGADNLYIYDAISERVSFIADLCSGEGSSGTLTEPRCFGDDAKSLWAGPPGRAFSTSNGRVLAFTTFAQLTPDDLNETQDVYRYDALTGGLARVSVGHDREDQDGNAGGGPALLSDGLPNQFTVYSQAALADRSVSDDGSTIVFRTARPLQAGDENEKLDVYEWHEGEVSLISGGHSTSDSGGTATEGAVTVDPSGRDIVFKTDQGFTPADTDGIPDIYDARIDGGFPPPPQGAPRCKSAEGCHGEATHAPAPPNIPHLIGPGNESVCHQGVVKRHGRCVQKKRRARCRGGFVKRHRKCVRNRHRKRHHRRDVRSTRRGER